MKIFETPEMKISVFENENVVTTSGGNTTAVQQALADANAKTGELADSVGTLQVDLW